MSARSEELTYAELNRRADHLAARGVPVGHGATEDVVAPLGLVYKLGSWHLVASRLDSESPVVYRLGYIEQVEQTGATRPRPPGFHVREFWDPWFADFMRQQSPYALKVRMSPDAMCFRESLGWLLRGNAESMVEEEDGWVRTTLLYHSRPLALAGVLVLLDHIEVLEPSDVRAEVASAAASVAGWHRRGSDVPSAPTRPVADNGGTLPVRRWAS